MSQSESYKVPRLESDSRRLSSNFGQFLCAPFGGRFWGHSRSRICDLGGRFGLRDRRTGFPLNQIEIDGFERFWRQKLRFWRRRCAPPKNPDPRTERVQNGVSRVTRKPTSDSWRVSGLLFSLIYRPKVTTRRNYRFRTRFLGSEGVIVNIFTI